MIISASRRTDIPALYPDWFINRLKAGFLLTRNPLNRTQISQINLAPDKVDCIVFWTKNPQPIFKYLNYLNSYLTLLVLKESYGAMIRFFILSISIIQLTYNILKTLLQTYQVILKNVSTAF
jgi:hypothetical protein